jgi:hypothetical protein
MQNCNTRSRTREMGEPRLPNGRQVGIYSEEDGKLVWTRNVCQKHLLRFLDAWTINDDLLRQVAADGVHLIRYQTREGVYEVSLAEFMEGANLLRAFACDEDVYALPRGSWSFEPKSGSKQLKLLLMKRDDN